MRELLRTNDAVLLSFVEATLKGLHIAHEVWDRHTSAVEGSIGIFPRRVMVDDGDWRSATLALIDAGLERELCMPSSPANVQPAKTAAALITQRKWVWPWHRA